VAKKPDNVLVGLDLGTTKVCAIVGEVKDGGQVDIIGIGISPSHGLKKGVVVNIDSTVESIKKAVHEAELMAGVEINSVYVGISGGHIKGINSRGVAAIKNREVGSADVARAIDGARAVNIPMDRRSFTCSRRNSSSTTRTESKNPSACRERGSTSRCISSPAP